jgi:hypothetical protein
LLNTGLFLIKRKFVRNIKYKKIVSFCLYGNSSRYIDGAIKNVINYKKYLPNYICRFYVSNDFDKLTIDKLIALDAEVIIMSKSGIDSRYLNWRFLVLFDKSVDVFLIRDCDSILNERELIILENWISSGKYYHIIRDHPNHTEKIMGGLWGGINTKKFNKNLFYIFPFYNAYGNDQLFLSRYIYPRIRDNAYIFDQFHFFINENVDSMDYELENLSFVGMIETDLNLKEKNLAVLKERLEFK